MNKKTIYILVAVLVIVIVVAGVGLYLYMGTGGEGGGGGGGGGETVYTVANATNLQFDVNLTTSGEVGIYLFAAKNVDTSTMMLRVDSNPVVSAGTTYSNIMYANQTAYSNATGTWAASDFATDWPTWSTQFESYKTKLIDNWSGTGDYSYTDSTGDVLIYNIKVQPSLPDSLFAPG